MQDECHNIGWTIASDVPAMVVFVGRRHGGMVCDLVVVEQKGNMEVLVN